VSKESVQGKLQQLAGRSAAPSGAASEDTPGVAKGGGGGTYPAI